MAMTQRGIEHSIAFLMGEVHGLLLFSQLMGKLYPNQPILLTKLEELKQFGLATIAPNPVPDAVAEGFEFAVDEIRKSLITGAANP
ncbi:MAG TPA: hypothetical protein VFN79_15105 [Steroidobacteraceae bacterium]|nr:hypothetical protein [Steroidobacteraceae bacterium]